MRKDGLRQLAREYFLLTLSTGRRVSLDSVVFDWTFGAPGQGTMDIPFASRPSAAVGPDGVFLTDGKSLAIRRYDFEGRLEGLLRVAGSRRATTQALIDAAIDRRVAALPESMRGARARAHEQTPIPDSLPTFSSLKVDALGWLWAEVFRPDPEDAPEWMLFDREGRAHGTLRTPPGTEIFSIGSDHIVGVWRDSLDVEYVRRHRLFRTEN